MKKSAYLFKLSAIGIGIGISLNAFAAGFQINEVSPTIQAAALADAATASGDISGMAFNPAILGTIQSTDIYLGGSIIIPSIGYNNAQAISPSGIPISGGLTSESNISPAALVPAFYTGTNIPDIPSVKVGIGADSPFGLTTDYDPNWVGGANALDSTIKTVNVFPTIAWQIIPNLSVGASVNFEHISANYSDALSVLNGSAWGVGYTLGAIYNITPATTIGTDYHSSVRESINGTATIQESPYDANVNIRLPGSVNFGISQKLNDKLTLMAGAQWTEWSSIQGININIPALNTQQDSVLNYQNSWLYSLGASYLLTPKLTLVGGLAYDETPTVNEYRDARIPDTNRKWLTAGVQYAASKNLSFFGTYEHIFMNNQSINETDTTPFGPVTLSANYTGYANIVAGGLNYVF